MDEENKQDLIKNLAVLAREADTENPIDWGLLNITEDQAFVMMAGNVVEQMEAVPADQQHMVALATVVKLLVENFVLNLRLKGAENVKNEI